ncbi:proline--tRNA ligase [Athalassotoga sp.]|uniref:proline--tRNA ligase n=1 Tax=Athalassotoga sp. TaxID=2022597 RepID=UPI003D032C85
MYWSKLYAPTLKESPSDADIKSAELLIRGGFIRKSASGVFSYLPLGTRVLQKITQIVREEMNIAGAQELLMPIMQPSEIWKITGRWDDYGPEMMKFRDRNDREFTLGPTHEEMITTLVKDELRSYKQLPVNLYQINTKYRDEIRPRFGLLRGREFIMKDAYSFHTSPESLDQTYKDMYNAYSRICERMNMKYVAVEADTGAIGGSNSHEFTAFAESGESDILVCEKCGYSATQEKAECSDDQKSADEPLKTLTLVETPNVRTVDELAKFLKIEKGKIVKSMVFTGKNGYVMALIRGDLEINIPKLKSYLGDQTLRFATAEEVFEKFSSQIGYIGPIGVKAVRIVSDNSVKNLKNYVVGGLKNEYHYINVNHERDYKINEYTDIRVVVDGDKCPKCGSPLKLKKGIEVGQVFKLGTKYSEKLSATYVDSDGSEKYYVMGCYGWGVSRTMAAVVEQFHDEKGIIWPRAIAPFEVVVTIVNTAMQDQVRVGHEIHEMLEKHGIEVLLDDRDVSAGFKFKDADLIGIPLRITCGKSLENGDIELKLRNSDKSSKVKIEDRDSVLRSVETLLESYKL